MVMMLQQYNDGVKLQAENPCNKLTRQQQHRTSVLIDRRPHPDCCDTRCTMITEFKIYHYCKINRQKRKFVKEMLWHDIGSSVHESNMNQTFLIKNYNRILTHRCTD